MKDGEFVAKRNRHPSDAEHYVGYVNGIRVALLYRPDRYPCTPWGVQFFNSLSVSWWETASEAAAYARAYPTET